MGKVIKSYKYRGKWKKKEIDEPDYLYKKDVIKLIGKEKWKEFNKWMYGQTCPVMSNGTTGYYKWDVQNFLDGGPILD